MATQAKKKSVPRTRANRPETAAQRANRIFKQLSESQAEVRKFTGWWLEEKRRADRLEMELNRLRGMAAGVIAIASDMQSPRSNAASPDLDDLIPF